MRRPGFATSAGIQDDEPPLDLLTSRAHLLVDGATEDLVELVEGVA